MIYCFLVKAVIPFGESGIYLYKDGEVMVDNMDTIIQQNVLMMKKSPTKVAASLGSSNEGEVAMLMDEET